MYILNADLIGGSHHESYIKCKYCSGLIKYEDNHLCEQNNYNETDGLQYCYSCGKKDTKYSKTQLQKEEYARCLDCVKNAKFDRYEPYVHLYKSAWPESSENKNKQLINCVSGIDYDAVSSLLKQGADPNYNVQEFKYIKGEYIYLYNEDGTEMPQYDQPRTPLELCVFRMSDCLLTDEKRGTIVKIATLLIESGASRTQDALSLYESRYGPVEPVEDEEDIHYRNLARLLLAGAN